MKAKNLDCSPPGDFLSKVELARVFPSLTTAKNLWGVSEGLLRAEGVWPRIPIVGTSRLVHWSGNNHDYTILAYHRIGFKSDYISVLSLDEGFEVTNVHRIRGYSLVNESSESGRLVERDESREMLKERLQMRLVALSVTKSGGTQHYEFFL